MPKTTKKEKDQRKIAGAPIHAKATCVLHNFKEAVQFFGSEAKIRFVNGFVKDVMQRMTGKRSMTYILGHFFITNVEEREVEIPLSRVVAGEFPEEPMDKP